MDLFSTCKIVPRIVVATLEITNNGVDRGHVMNGRGGRMDWLLHLYNPHSCVVAQFI